MREGVEHPTARLLILVNRFWLSFQVKSSLIRAKKNFNEGGCHTPVIIQLNVA